MEFIKSFSLLIAVSATCVFAEEGLLVACDVQDIQCLGKSTEKFLSSTANGIPQYDIKPIDPMKVEAIDQDLGPEYGIQHHLRDLTVTGFKNQVIRDFKMDTTAKTVFLKVVAKINIVGKLSIEYTKPSSQTFEANYGADGDVQISTSYPYDVQKDATGVEHFVVGQETIECEALDTPKYTVDPQLLAQLNAHPELKEARQKFAANASPLLKDSMCDLVKKVYPTVVHNIRASAKILPKTAYFKNL